MSNKVFVPRTREQIQAEFETCYQVQQRIRTDKTLALKVNEWRLAGYTWANIAGMLDAMVLL